MDLPNGAGPDGALVRVLGEEGADALDGEHCDVQGLLAAVEGPAAIFVNGGEQERVVPGRVCVAENAAGGWAFAGFAGVGDLDLDWLLVAWRVAAAIEGVADLAWVDGEWVRHLGGGWVLVYCWRLMVGACDVMCVGC